jgi:hypothetical protein
VGLPRPINASCCSRPTATQTSFLLLQRANGTQYRLPSEPTLSPDRQNLVTADFCADGCDGELAVWRVTRDDVAQGRSLEAASRGATPPRRGRTRTRCASSTRPTARRADARATLDAPAGRAPGWTKRSPLATPDGAARTRAPIRSYVLRQGRMSPAQQRACDDAAAALRRPFAPAPLDFARASARARR